MDTNMLSNTEAEQVFSCLQRSHRAGEAFLKACMLELQICSPKGRELLLVVCKLTLSLSKLSMNVRYICSEVVYVSIPW